MTIAEFNQRVEYQGAADREIAEWIILDIHQIPTIILEKHELDFYCCNNKEVYLLRLRNRALKKLTVVKDDKYGGPTYLIAELPITKIDDDLILSILREFEIA